MDSRTPVLVAAGQVNQHGDDERALDPVSLMAVAARQAAAPELLAAVEAVRVVNLLSWRYRDPGRLLAEFVGASPKSTTYSGVGGNTPQTLVSQACVDIQAGRADVVMLAGGEAWRTRMKLRANGVKPDWPRQDDTVALAQAGDDVPMSSDTEERIGLDRPSYVYPIFEQAIRLDRQESSDGHRRRLGELWSMFSAVAESNPHAWTRARFAPEEISQPRPDNRMICWPYPKLLNSNNMVDQAAVLILTSVEAARRFRIPIEQWVFPYSGTDAHDTYAIAERAELHRSPAIRLAGRRALELADTHIDDVDMVDVYSCFPSAVQVAAAELGLKLDDPSRPLTVTGGLTFAGGPWNNYVMHSIATAAGRLIREPGRRALITANGGYLTKHSFGVYGTAAPKGEFRWEDVQPAVDREPSRAAHATWEGVGRVESWTAPYDRDGRPARIYVAVRTPDDARTLAVVDDGTALASVPAEFAGMAIRVRPDGTASLV
jgi:acetyl-CoA C-acetyltransferase